MSSRFLAGLLVLAAFGAVACTEDQRAGLVDQGTEAVVRNIASAAGEAAFENEGFEIDGGLDCEATSTGGAERVELRCTGSSTRGEELVLEGDARTGSAEPGNAVRGSFVGTADGDEVFRQECLGDGC
ncbi:MAG TPA: hypothetical protein VG993_10215 [Actinomycetota bacterium]|jgi:hypothetical protein|nr:hypothetical protein [Actinomycetota bacterium]